MFAQLLATLDTMLSGASFGKYLSLTLVGLTIALLPHLAADSSPYLSHVTVTILALPGFVLLYGGLGGLVAHLWRQAHRP